MCVLRKMAYIPLLRGSNNWGHYCWILSAQLCLQPGGSESGPQPRDISGRAACAYKGGRKMKTAAETTWHHPEKWVSKGITGWIQQMQSTWIPQRSLYFPRNALIHLPKLCAPIPTVKHLHWKASAAEKSRQRNGWWKRGFSGERSPWANHQNSFLAYHCKRNSDSKTWDKTRWRLI